MRALSKVATYAEWRRAAPGQVPRFDDALVDDARRLCAGVVSARGEAWLTAEEMERLLTAYHLPLVLGVLTRDPDEASAVAAAIGYPVVAKLSARNLIHKSDIGGVITSLRTAAEVRDAVSRLLANAAAHDIHPEGVLIQPMIVGRRRDHGRAWPTIRCSARSSASVSAARTSNSSATCTSESCPSLIGTQTTSSAPAARCRASTGTEDGQSLISPRSRRSCCGSRSSLRICRKYARSTSTPSWRSRKGAAARLSTHASESARCARPLLTGGSSGEKPLRPRSFPLADGARPVTIKTSDRRTLEPAWHAMC